MNLVNALHAILGATEIASLFLGTHTKSASVELPSQMLEEWLIDKKDVEKKVSGHYVTGQPLPDDVIDTIIELKNLTSGYFVTRQTYLASMALAYFGQGEQKDPYTIMQKNHNKIMYHSAFAQANHFYALFWPLDWYGAKYYGYLWSKVFALIFLQKLKYLAQFKNCVKLAKNTSRKF